MLRAEGYSTLLNAVIIAKCLRSRLCFYSIFKTSLTYLCHTLHNSIIFQILQRHKLETNIKGMPTKREFGK